MKQKKNEKKRDNILQTDFTRIYNFFSRQPKKKTFVCHSQKRKNCVKRTLNELQFVKSGTRNYDDCVGKEKKEWNERTKTKTHTKKKKNNTWKEKNKEKQPNLPTDAGF